MDDSELSPIGRGALELVDAGMAVFPLHPMSKVPWTKHGLNDWDTNKNNIRDFWLRNPTANVGVACGAPSHGLVVIDLDTHGDSNGITTLERWEVEHGKLPETVTSITGSGGRHLLYRCDREIRNSTNGELGVDIRGDGGFIAAPPSIHPDGPSYEWSISPDDMDVATANGQVYEFIDFVRPTHKVTYGTLPERFELPGAIDHDRNVTLFKYGSSLRARGLSEPEIVQLVTVANSTRCRPPLDDAEVAKICGSVTRYEQGKQKPQEQADTEISRSGLTKAEKLKNVTTIEICQMMADEPSISNGIKFDVLDRRAWKMAPLPWDETNSIRPIADSDTDALFGMLEYGNGIRNKSQFDIAFSQFTTLPSQQVNPIQEAMARHPQVRMGWGYDGSPDSECDVSWDGGETWEHTRTVAGSIFSTYLGVEMNEYNFYVELLVLKELYARVMFPGCKADYMPVLTGAQGIGKSTFVRLLAIEDRFYLENFSRFDEEHKRRLLGKMVAEVSELDGFDFQKMASIKALITEAKDTMRFPYDRRTIDAPRTSIFVGTTNEGSFLSDTTGNRRFLPIKCGRTMCEPHPGLFDGSAQRDILQAYGEVAAYCDHVGRDAFLASLVVPKNIQQTALEVQQAYTQEDDVYVAVSSWLDQIDPTIQKVNVKMVMIEGMGYTNESFSRERRYVKNDVARALSQCPGWEKMAGKQRVGRWGISQTWHRVA